MADQIEEVKQKTDIVSLIAEYLDVKKAGRNYKALCPFHGEKTPSFMISPELQIYKCFGCSESGDCFTFLEKYEGMEFSEALKFLAEKAGVKLAPLKGGGGEKEKILEINRLTGMFYQYFLLNHQVGKNALAYLLKERGLKLATIKEFGLGFSPENPIALKKFLIDKKKFTPREVEGAGIGYPKGGLFIDRLRGRVIFPLFDHRGNYAGFAGRILPWAKDQDMAKYINTPETPVYHKGSLLYALNLTKPEIKHQETAIVVEGELDAVSSWQAGIKNVVAIKGSALTEDQIRLLSRFAKKAILALDSDLAGDAAARRGVIVAQEAGMEVKVAQIEGFKDPDEAARGNPEAYKKALIDSLGIWDFLVNGVFSRFDAKTGEGKAKISREVIPILSLIVDKIVQAHYVNLVARRLEVPEEAVAEQLAGQKGKEEPRKMAKTAEMPPEKKDRHVLLEERLFSLCFRYNPGFLLKEGIGSLIQSPLARRILEEYVAFSKKHKVFNASEFAQALPKELFDGFAEMALTEDAELTDESQASKETAIVRHELAVLSLKEKLIQMSFKIHECEARAEKKKLEKFKEKFKELTEKLRRLEEDAKQGIILDNG